MKTGCLGEPPDVGEAGQIKVVVLQPERDGKRTLGRTRPHAVRCDIAPWNTCCENLLRGRPVILYFDVRVLHVFLNGCIADFRVLLTCWPYPLDLKSKWGRCRGRPRSASRRGLLCKCAADHSQYGKKSNKCFNRDGTWHEPLPFGHECTPSGRESELSSGWRTCVLVDKKYLPS